MNLKDITDKPVEVSESLTFENNFSSDIEIDRTSLNEEFANQPSKFAYYGSLHAIMNKKLQEITRERKDLYARIDKDVRDAAAGQGKKLTETMVENMVITSPKYVEKLKEENKVSLVVNLLEVQKEAMKQRKDMLIQLGADNRQTAVDARVYNDVHRDKKF